MASDGAVHFSADTGVAISITSAKVSTKIQKMCYYIVINLKIWKEKN